MQATVFCIAVQEMPVNNLTVKSQKGAVGAGVLLKVVP